MRINTNKKTIGDILKDDWTFKSSFGFNGYLLERGTEQAIYSLNTYEIIHKFGVVVERGFN